MEHFVGKRKGSDKWRGGSDCGGDCFCKGRGIVCCTSEGAGMKRSFSGSGRVISSRRAAYLFQESGSADVSICGSVIARGFLCRSGSDYRGNRFCKGRGTACYTSQGFFGRSRRVY